MSVSSTEDYENSVDAKQVAPAEVSTEVETPARVARGLVCELGGELGRYLAV